MSGYGRFQDRVRGREAGFDSYLVKPIDLAVLQKLLKGPETSETAEQLHRAKDSQAP
jgi:DNA-binding response OmpR family regulator